jgi:SSS family solute:Na+ symporter
MHWLDWTILLGTLGFIVAYGVWKTRGTHTAEGYMRGGDDARWWGVGLSVMATQASAITFLSTPDKATWTVWASCSSTSACRWRWW